MRSCSRCISASWFEICRCNASTCLFRCPMLARKCCSDRASCFKRLMKQATTSSKSLVSCSTRSGSHLVTSSTSCTAAQVLHSRKRPRTRSSFATMSLVSTCLGHQSQPGSLQCGGLPVAVSMFVFALVLAVVVVSPQTRDIHRLRFWITELCARPSGRDPNAEPKHGSIFL